MRGPVERFARRWWSGELGSAGAALSILAAPLSWAWAAANRLRELRYRDGREVRVEGLAVASIGNLAVGGTGKTPVAAWVARRTRDAGVPTWVLTGAHGEDEARLHRSWNLDVPVVVDRDRVAGARRARAEGARIAVLDDGFQHRRLARDLDLVLLSAEDRFPGALLPRGPYREQAGALGRADAVLVTRRRAGVDASRRLAAQVERVAPGLVRAGIHLADGPWTSLEGGRREPPSGAVLAVCGVARAGLFRTTVAARVDGVVELAAFADHHGYRRREVIELRRRAGDRPIVTTEKDAIKLRPHMDVLGETCVLTEELRWDWGEVEAASALEALVARGHAVDAP